mgnify:CR=1 FL=1
MTGGVIEIAEEDKTGTLVLLNDFNKMAEAITCLLGNLDAAKK